MNKHSKGAVIKELHLLKGVLKKRLHFIHCTNSYINSLERDGAHSVREGGSW